MMSKVLAVLRGHWKAVLLLSVLVGVLVAANLYYYYHVTVPVGVINFLCVLAGVGWETYRPYYKKVQAYGKACDEAKDQGLPKPAPADFGLGKFGVRFDSRFLRTAVFSVATMLVVAYFVQLLYPSSFVGPALIPVSMAATRNINRELL